MEHIIFVASVLLVMSLFLAAKLKSKSSAAAPGQDVSRMLDAYAKRNGCRTLHNIPLAVGESVGAIDHIVFGRFGMAIITEMTMSGMIIGNSYDREILHKIGTKTHRLKNPLQFNKDCTAAVRRRMARAGFSEFPVWSFAVFTSQRADISGFSVPGVVKLSGLERALDSLPERPCDYAFAYKTIKETMT